MLIQLEIATDTGIKFFKTSYRSATEMRTGAKLATQPLLLFFMIALETIWKKSELNGLTSCGHDARSYFERYCAAAPPIRFDTRVSSARARARARIGSNQTEQKCNFC